MRVADLMELLSHVDPNAEVRYSFLAFSEYGEDVEGEGSLDEDSVAMEDGAIVFHCAWK